MTIFSKGDRVRFEYTGKCSGYYKVSEGTVINPTPFRRYDGKEAILVFWDGEESPSQPILAQCHLIQSGPDIIEDWRL